MKNPFCKPSISADEALNLSYIANFVFNIFSSYTAIMLNIVTIHAVRKTSSLPKPLKSLLLSLAVSDLGVGLLVQPLYITLLGKWLHKSDRSICGINTAFVAIMTLFSLASYFSVVAISVDRFLAINLHLRYKELVSHKRVVAVVISIWVFSAFLTLNDLWIPRIISAIVAVILFACFLATTVVYCKIYFAVRHHARNIHGQAMYEEHNGQAVSSFKRLVKSALGTFYVYLVFVVCYLPFYCCFVLVIFGSNSIVDGFSLYSWTLMFLNSSLNPVIYCWKMRHIRCAVMEILRNLFAKQN